MQDTVKMTKINTNHLEMFGGKTKSSIDGVVHVYRFYDCKKCGELAYMTTDDEKLSLPNYCGKCGNELFYE